MAIILGGSGVDAQVVAGPNIVTDGLVFYIDPADTSSLGTAGNVALVNGTEVDYIYGQLGDTQRVDFTSTGTGAAGFPYYSPNNQGYLFTGINDTQNSRGAFSKKIVVQEAYTIDFWLAPRFTGGNTWLSADRTNPPIRDGQYALLSITQSPAKINTSFYPSLSRTLTTDKWVNIVIAINGSTATYYTEGVSRGAQLRTDFSVTSLTIDNIGNPNYSIGAGDGALGPVKLYNRAITAQEVLQNYNAIKNRYTI